MSSNPIEIEAGEWLAKLDAGEDSAALREALESWRAADPRHEVAYLRLKAGWRRLDRLQALRPAVQLGIEPYLLAETGMLAEKLGTQDTDTAPAVFVKKVSAQRLGRGNGYLAVAAAAALAVMGAVWSLYFQGTEHYVTAVGGFQRILLKDGSVVQLNTASELRASFTNHRRNVELVRGEATFSVAHDVARPFVVTAGDTSVRVLGTQFNVRMREGQRLDVIVTEGEVAVGPSSGWVPAMTESVAGPSAVSDKIHSPKLSLVLAGQVASIAKDEVRVRPSVEAETARQLAWQAGMLVFNGEPLSDVVKEFNRYNPQQLVVVDPSIASLKIGGYFKAINLEVFVKVLENDFGVRAALDGDKVELLGAATAD